MGTGGPPRGLTRTSSCRRIKQVAGPSFFALLVIAVSFLPVLTLEAQEGRLFRPLAYTKTLSMVVAAVLAITLDPALRMTFTHVRTFRSARAGLPAGQASCSPAGSAPKHSIPSAAA